MQRHTFSALITLDPSRHDLVLRYLDGTRTYGIVQSCGRYFPASICCGSPSSPSVMHAIVHIQLLPGEADALFSSGQVFILWADAIVSDDTVRGDGSLGDGVIVGREPASDQDAPRTASRRELPYRPAAPARTGLGTRAAATDRKPGLARAR